MLSLSSNPSPVFSYKKTKTKSLRVVLLPSSSFEVRVPRSMPLLFAKAFVKRKERELLLLQTKRNDFLVKHLSICKADMMQVHTKEEKDRYKKKALLLIKEKLESLSFPFDQAHTRIAITETRTRWGSCSKEGVISFHYRILFLPDHLAKYLIVHEYCHLKEMNHSKHFWDLVGSVLPEYKSSREVLRKIPTFS